MHSPEYQRKRRHGLLAGVYVGIVLGACALCLSTALLIVIWRDRRRDARAAHEAATDPETMGILRVTLQSPPPPYMPGTRRFNLRSAYEPTWARKARALGLY